MYLPRRADKGRYFVFGHLKPESGRTTFELTIIQLSFVQLLCNILYFLNKTSSTPVLRVLLTTSLAVLPVFMEESPIEPVVAGRTKHYENLAPSNTYRSAANVLCLKVRVQLDTLRCRTPDRYGTDRISRSLKQSAGQIFC